MKNITSLLANPELLNTSFPQQAFLPLSRDCNADYYKQCIMNSCIGACHLIRMIVTEHSAFSFSKYYVLPVITSNPIIENSTEWRTLHLELAALFITILEKNYFYYYYSLRNFCGLKKSMRESPFIQCSYPQNATVKFG